MRDHALFIAFAPADDPQIALAVLVENGGFGARRRGADRAPGVRLLLARQVPERGRHRGDAAGQSTAPIGMPRPIDSVPLPGATVDGAATARADASAPPPAASAPAAPSAPGASWWRSAQLHERRLRQPSLWQRCGRSSPASTARCCSPSCCSPCVGLRDAVLGRLRPRHALRRPRPQHGCSRSACHVRGRADPAADADALGGAALHRRRRAAGRASRCFGITKNGATRWLNVGVAIQPSEIMKIAMPLMLAWYFQKPRRPAARCSTS